MRIFTGLIVRLTLLLPLSVQGPWHATIGDSLPKFLRRQSFAIGEPLSSSACMPALRAESATSAGLKTKARSLPLAPSPLMSPATRGVIGAPDRAVMPHDSLKVFLMFVPRFRPIECVAF